MKPMLPTRPLSSPFAYGRRRGWAALAWLVLTLYTAPAAADIAERYPQVKEIFPQAERFGPLEGDPPAAAVYQGQEVIGYAFLTADVLRIPAYSGKPINTLVGFDRSGRITGIAIVHHEEPILAVGITPERLKRFVEQYVGKSVFDRITVGAEREGHVAIDTIAGATITVMVENATVTRAARAVAQSRGLSPPTPLTGPEAPTLNESSLPATAREPVSPSRKTPATATRPSTEVPLASKEAASAPTPTTGPAAAPAPPEAPLWIGVWRQRTFEIAVLAVSLTILTLVLVLQDGLVRHPRLTAWVRNAFLAYTLFFLGWYALAQLTVINVLTFVHSVMREFRWEHFLIDPMLFILWSFVAVTLLLWGRGVYCGWLCPFGALQELVNKIARRLGVPQLELPDVVHERLWAVKYVILVVLFGLSLQSMREAAVFAEVEPFKTTFGMRFQREWPFVLYAAGLIGITVINRKFFCKYLCPLGAALAIPGRFRLFDWWLRRRRECGKPCQVCAVQCPVRAIRPTGEINANECHYCLDCQVVYYDERLCPPLIERRKRRERLPRAREAVQKIESMLGAYGPEPSGYEEGEHESGRPRQLPS